MLHADIFLSKEAKQLLENKYVLFIGSSVQRSMYKDLVVLLQNDTYLTETDLRKKGEFHFHNDSLVSGGQFGQMTNGLGYREVRELKLGSTLVRFYFITCCYGPYVEEIMADVAKDRQPDVLILNSCLWDITRYGQNSISDYKDNLEKLFELLDDVLSGDCLVIWNTTLPVSKTIKAGFLLPELEFLSDTLRLDVMEANYFAREVVVNHGYDVLDMHYFFRRQLHRRVADGVHWDMTAHRRMSNLLLAHISEAWQIPLPQNIPSIPVIPTNIEFNARLVGRSATVHGMDVGQLRDNYNQQNHNGRAQQRRGRARQRNGMQARSANTNQGGAPNENNGNFQNCPQFQVAFDFQCGQNPNQNECLSLEERHGGPVRRPDYMAGPGWLDNGCQGGRGDADQYQGNNGGNPHGEYQWTPYMQNNCQAGPRRGRGRGRGHALRQQPYGGNPNMEGERRHPHDRYSVGGGYWC